MNSIDYTIVILKKSETKAYVIHAVNRDKKPLFSYLTHLVLLQGWIPELSCKVPYIKIAYMPSYKKSPPFSASSLSLPQSPLPLTAISFDLAQINPFAVLLGCTPPH